MIPVTLSPFAHWLLAISIFLFIPLSIIAPHSIVGIIVIGGLTGLYYSQKRPLPNLPSALIAILFLIPSWALVTALWSQHPGASFIASLKILALVILGVYWCRLSLKLPHETQKSLIIALMSGLCLGLAFLIIDAWLENPWQVFWGKSSAKAFAQGSLMISLGAWPILCWIFHWSHPLWLRVSLAMGFTILVLGTLLQVDCDTSFIGLLLGIGVFLGTLIFPRITSWKMRLCIPAFIISFPFISLYAFMPNFIPTYNSFIYSPSYLDRLYIWNDVATSIFESPWKGIGMGETRYHEKASEERHWSYIDKDGVQRKHQTKRFAMHPHNAILELWLELGLLGLALGLWLAHQLLSCIYKSRLYPMDKAIGAGLFMGAFLIVWVNLGFWQTWWISGLWTMIGLTTMTLKSAEESQ